MAKSVQDILRLIRDEGIQMVDFKMVDIHGQFRHVTIPAENFSEDMMTDGVGFDASNYGYAVVEKSDMVFIPDLDTAYRVLNDLVAKEPAVLMDPAPQIVLAKCADSSLDFAVRVWVKADDYWPVNFRLLDKGKRALDAAGISIPFPQMDVHVKS